MDIYRVNGHSLTSDAKYKKKKTNLKKPKVTTQNNFTIDDEYINKVCFKETLAIVNENQEELGEFIGKIRRCNFKTNSTSLMININSTNVSECGQKIGMSLITNTTTDFHSYEEKWSQRLCNKSNMKGKTVLISCEHTGAAVKICTELNDGVSINQINHNDFNINENLLSEGMNYAFLRYIAIKGFEGSIMNRNAVTIDGKLCKTVYHCSLEKNYKIKNKQIPVMIIKRILLTGKTTSTEMTSVLTRSGYLLKHTWDSQATSNQLVIKKSMRIRDDGTLYDDAMLYLEDNWDTDIRLKSMYLDKISEMKIKYENYIKNNRAVKDMIIDYIKEILLAKPNDVLQFSIDYFDELNQS